MKYNKNSGSIFGIFFAGILMLLFYILLSAALAGLFTIICWIFLEIHRKQIEKLKELQGKKIENSEISSGLIIGIFAIASGAFFMDLKLSLCISLALIFICWIFLEFRHSWIENIIAFQNITKDRMRNEEQIVKTQDSLVKPVPIKQIEVIDIPEFETMKEVIRMTALGYNDACIINSEGGLGKSYVTTQVLKQLEINFKYFTGYSTLISFYAFLYQHKDQVIVLDDTEGLLSDKYAVGVLKSALWPVNGKRLVEYRSSSHVIKNIPKSFNFTGRIIVLCNSVKRDDPDINALLTRFSFYDLQLSRDQKLSIMQKILSTKNVAQDQKIEIMRILNETDKPLNFRSLDKLIQLFKYNPSTAKDMFDQLTVAG